MSEGSPIYDVAIIGGGPAGLAAAMTLGRCQRRVVLLDHGQPRNAAARAVHGYLGLDGISPSRLRELGREEARTYGAQILDEEVRQIECAVDSNEQPCGFTVHTPQRRLLARKLLLATGVVDELPQVENFEQFYGQSVHHCPYCDGWEHRQQPLAAMGAGGAAIRLALELRAWSPDVTACTEGEPLRPAERKLLAEHDLPHREERIVRLEGVNGQLERVVFEKSEPLSVRALFFSAAQTQRCNFPEMLGCRMHETGLVARADEQQTSVPGVFVAGDADSSVQMAMVAGAEGIIAATAINAELQHEQQQRGSARDGCDDAEMEQVVRAIDQ